MTKREQILVIGATRGFGQALALRLAADGHCVLAAGRSPAALAGASVLEVDVTDADSIARLFGEAMARGPVDAMVYCPSSTGAVGPAWDCADEEVRDVLDVGITGFTRCVRHAIPPMLAAGHGRILVVGSAGASNPVALLAAYCAAKAALEQYARCIAAELSGSGVTCNIVQISAETALAQTHRREKERVRGAPSQHPPLPDVTDNLDPALFLLSPQARHVNGQTLLACQP